MTIITSTHVCMYICIYVYMYAVTYTNACIHVCMQEFDVKPGKQYKTRVPASGKL